MLEQHVSVLEYMDLEPEEVTLIHQTDLILRIQGCKRHREIVYRQLFASLVLYPERTNHQLEKTHKLVG